MTSQAIDINTTKHYTWGDNCVCYVLLDSPLLSVKHELMPPQTKEKRHYHKKAEQFFYLLKGDATFFVNETSITVKQGQGLHIKAGERHFIENKNNEEIGFLVISQPAVDNDRITVKEV